jgi:hypothetical protein
VIHVIKSHGHLYVLFGGIRRKLFFRELGRLLCLFIPIITEILPRLKAVDTFLKKSVCFFLGVTDKLLRSMVKKNKLI